MRPPPFLSCEPMQGNPPCNWNDFLSPQLRRFPLAYDKVRLTKVLGHGIEGCVAKVQFDGGESRFALKVFFNSVPIKGQWWPLEREAHNVAVLEKVQAGLRESSPAPVHVPAKRTTRLGCLRCLYAFSAEGRRGHPFDGLPPAQRVAMFDSFTRIRKCFGWTRVRGADFVAMNKVIVIDHDAAARGQGSASYIEADKQYFALVYEYIPSAKLEGDAVQRQLEFFHHIGFHPCQGLDEKNWQGPGILLDLGDYSSPADIWFPGRSAYDPPMSAEVLIDWPRVRDEATKEWNRKQELRLQGTGPTEEDKQVEDEELAREMTAKFVEWGYQGNRRYKSFFDLSPDEVRELGLEEDALAHIRMPEIEPRTLRKTWKAYKKQKLEYLSDVEKGNSAMINTAFTE